MKDFTKFKYDKPQHPSEVAQSKIIKNMKLFF